MVTWQEERLREWGSYDHQSTLGPLSRHLPDPPWSCPRQQKGLTNSAIPHLQRDRRTAHICSACQSVGNRPSRFALLLSSQGAPQRRSHRSFPLRGECGPNSQDRNRPPLARAAPARLHRGPDPFHPGSPGPRRPGPESRTHHPAGPRGMRALRRAPTAPGQALRAAASPRVWRSRSCYPETEGRKTAPAARPSRAALPPPGTKETKPRRPGPAPLLPPRPPGHPPPAAARARPEAAGRAGRAAPSRPGPRIPALQSRRRPRAGDPTPPARGREGGRLHPSCRHGNAGRPGDEEGTPGATAAPPRRPHLPAALELELGAFSVARGRGGGSRSAPASAGGTAPRPLPAPPEPGRTRVPHLLGPFCLRLAWPRAQSSLSFPSPAPMVIPLNFLYLNSEAPCFFPAHLALPTRLPSSQSLLPAPTSGCWRRAWALDLACTIN
ncbi:uncharacterized protein LOC118147924 [Callithrix jacchus]